MSDPINYDSNDELLANLDLPSPTVARPNIADFMSVYGEELKHLDIDIEEVYDDRYIQSATGRELEKLARYVGVRRQNQESDAKFRKRILGNFFALSSDTTFEDFSRVTKDIVDADPDDVSIQTPPESNAGEINVVIDGAVLDESPLTVQEITNLLSKAVPAGHTANILEVGTFAFAGGDSSLEGFNEGTWSSTID